MKRDEEKLVKLMIEVPERSYTYIKREWDDNDFDSPINNISIAVKHGKLVKEEMIIDDDGLMHEVYKEKSIMNNNIRIITGKVGEGMSTIAKEIASRPCGTIVFDCECCGIPQSEDTLVIYDPDAINDHPYKITDYISMLKCNLSNIIFLHFDHSEKYIDTILQISDLLSNIATIYVFVQLDHDGYIPKSYSKLINRL